ncbi:MAG: hypothetical protein ACOYN4_19160, partial [Bacteroidales bacterium]
TFPRSEGNHPLSVFIMCDLSKAGFYDLYCDVWHETHWVSIIIENMTTELSYDPAGVECVTVHQFYKYTTFPRSEGNHPLSVFIMCDLS